MFDKAFTKDNLDLYMKEVAKAFRKRNGKSMPAEIVFIGGACYYSQFLKDEEG